MWPNFPQIVEKCASVAEVLDNNGFIGDFEFDPSRIFNSSSTPMKR